jgi:hypothetical protein
MNEQVVLENTVEFEDKHITVKIKRISRIPLSAAVLRMKLTPTLFFWLPQTVIALYSHGMLLCSCWAVLIHDLYEENPYITFDIVDVYNIDIGIDTDIIKSNLKKAT